MYKINVHGQTDGQTNGRKTDKRNFTNFERNRAISLSSLNSIGQTVFELESGNENVDRRMDRQTDEKRTNKRTEFHHLAMMVIYLPIKFEFDW